VPLTLFTEKYEVKMGQYVNYTRKTINPLRFLPVSVENCAFVSHRGRVWDKFEVGLSGKWDDKNIDIDTSRLGSAFLTYDQEKQF
jgi:hypothetical protein